MLTFVMLTRLSPDALRSPETLEQLEQAAMEHVHRDCPRVEWLHNFAILGPCDYLDIFRAPDLGTALQVAAIIRTYGHGTTEVWTAAEWKDYKDMLHRLPKAA
jgi:uncharacterized protein with GYD domain